MSRYLRASPWIQPAEILDRPYPPDSRDDEFIGSSLDGAWSRNGVWDDVNAIDPYAAFAGVTGTRWSYNSNRPSWFMLQPPGNGVAASLTKTITPPTNFFMWARMSFCYRNSTAPVADAQIALGLYDSGFNNSVNLELNDASVANQINAIYGRLNAGVFTTVKATATDGAVNAQGCQPIEAVGIQKIGTTYYGWVLTAQGWLYLGSQTHASSLVNVAIYWSNSVTTPVGNMVLGVDFVRIKEGTELP